MLSEEKKKERMVINYPTISLNFNIPVLTSFPNQMQMLPNKTNTGCSHSIGRQGLDIIVTVMSTVESEGTFM
jgi:hypothetical protein